jgi:hypothetical protein
LQLLIVVFEVTVVASFFNVEEVEVLNQWLLQIIAAAT